MKVKIFFQVDEEYSGPRFIVDSGGHRGKGVSIFIVQNELHCVVANGNKKWKVMLMTCVFFIRLSLYAKKSPKIPK